MNILPYIVGIPRKMGRGNPNPTYKLKRVYDEPVADKPVTVKLPIGLDAYVRSLPNKSEWLREAIAEKYQREQLQTS